MIELVVGFVIAAVLLIAEYILCTKFKSPLWGGIIPVLILAGTIWIFASGRIPLETRYLFPFVILNTLFFGDWGTGRDKYKKIKQADVIQFNTGGKSTYRDKFDPVGIYTDQGACTERIVSMDQRVQQRFPQGIFRIIPCVDSV